MSFSTDDENPTKKKQEKAEMPDCLEQSNTKFAFTK
jgi:hypothetical protein